MVQCVQFLHCVDIVALKCCCTRVCTGVLQCCTGVSQCYTGVSQCCTGVLQCCTSRVCSALSEQLLGSAANAYATQSRECMYTTQSRDFRRNRSRSLFCSSTSSFYGAAHSWTGPCNVHPNIMQHPDSRTNSQHSRLKHSAEKHSAIASKYTAAPRLKNQFAAHVEKSRVQLHPSIMQDSASRITVFPSFSFS